MRGRDAASARKTSPGRRTAGFILAALTIVGLSLVAQPGPTRASEDPQKSSSACLYQSEDAALCIRKASFNSDLCRTLDHFATRKNLPPAFFARLIWRESLFRPEAVSPKGAEGIAQFMPGTARLRGLKNSFDVIAALDASATYLDALREKFGNLGLAAAAYNAGEGGVDRFLATGRLPIETRDYVFAITGNLAETWKETPPDVAAPELAAKKAFLPACIALADTRQLNEPVLAGSADWAPWGVQLAGHYSPAAADRLFTRAILKLPAPLNAERALIVRQRGGNFGSRPRYAARIGRENRKEAMTLCADIRRAGGTCTVFRNR
jgi:soluble lytic murein transglycosylase-like protein